jgi:hypothetical protein
MNGGSGDVECEGMSIDGDGSEGRELMLMLTNLMVFGDECKDGTGIGNTRYNGTDVLLKTRVSTKFIH